MLTRQMTRVLAGPDYNLIGGNTKNIVRTTKGQFYKGPEWFTSAANEDGIYTGIYRD